MNLSLNVLMASHEDVRGSPMGGKHQRSLSLSAKWAGDKAMAIEYLRRQRDVMNWIETVLKHELPTTDLFEALKSGVVLREMMETLFPDASNCMSPISRNYSMRMGPWKERENISVFLRQCKSIGMNDLSLFCTDDLYEGTNMVQVLFCLQHFMMFSEEHAGHLFKPVVKNAPAEFSNQELELAMSKIEQAGDAKALKSLIASVPSKAVDREKEGFVRAASETASAEKITRHTEEEPAKEVFVQTEVCNQLSEELPEIDNPADDDDLTSEQENETKTDNEEDTTQFEVAAVSVHEIISAEDSLVSFTLAQDEETLLAIQQVLSNMATIIEEDEAEAQVKIRTSLPTTEGGSEVLSLEMITTPVEDKEAIEEENEIVAQVLENLVSEAKEELEQKNIEIEVTEEEANTTADAAEIPLESTPAANHVSTELVAETTEKVAVDEENAPHQTEDEELEAKAMAKCMCGRCTIM